MVLVLRSAVSMALASAFALMFTAFITQVVARYFFQVSLTWTEEVIRILYIWIIFGSVGTIVAWKDHVSIDFLVLTARGNWRRALMVVSRVVVIVIFVISIPATLDYLDYMRRIPTGVLRFPTGLVYGVYMVFCVGLPIMLAMDVRRILSREWIETDEDI